MHPTSLGGCISYVGDFDLYRRRSRQWWTRTLKLHIPGCICRFALGFCKSIKKRTETLYQSFSPFMVEVRGIEPLSEDSVSQFSPSAVRILTFPPLHAP